MSSGYGGQPEGEARELLAEVQPVGFLERLKEGRHLRKYSMPIRPLEVLLKAENLEKGRRAVPSPQDQRQRRFPSSPDPLPPTQHVIELGPLLWHGANPTTFGRQGEDLIKGDFGQRGSP